MGRYGSAGLTIWQKRHMPRAPRLWGPRAFGGPALTLFYYSPNFFVPCFSARSKQCAWGGGGPKEPKSPSPSPPNFKKRVPIKLGPNGFFVPCFSVSAWGPKEPKVLRKHQDPKFKNRQSQIAGPETVFCFLFQRRIRLGPRRVQVP